MTTDLNFTTTRHDAPVQNYTPPTIKRTELDPVRIGVKTSDEFSTSESSESSESTPMTDADRRAKRKEEFREAASIRERALKMQRDAEEQSKQYRQFSELMHQAKEDPTILAKALNMDPSEFSRKIFNKQYSIKDDPAPQKEESQEEKTQRRLDEYERFIEEEKERRAKEQAQNNDLYHQSIKRKYIESSILPCIKEEHEFIKRNDVESCAEMIYDLMNSAFQEHLKNGGAEQNFPLKAEDVVNEMEESLEKRAEEELQKARGISKLRKYFRDDDEFRYNDRDRFRSEDKYQEKSEDQPERQEFISKKSMYSRKPTISSSMGPSAPPTSFGEERSLQNRPVLNRAERLRRVQKVLGG